MNEDVWFNFRQRMLVQIANTDYGKALLNIDRGRVVRIRKNEVCYLLGIENGKVHLRSDFRVGAKWGNLIRTRWDQFDSYSRYFQSDYIDTASSLTRYARSLTMTTLTAYPDPNVETTTMDCEIDNSATPSYSTCHDAATGNANKDSAATIDIENGDEGVTNYYIKRGMALFDTSSITSGGSISTSTLSLYGHALLFNADNDSLSIVSSSPASNTASANADFDAFGTTKFASDILFSSISTSAYNDFSLNANGIANIDKAGVSKFGIRSANDVGNTAPGLSNGNYLQIKSADTAGTGSDPKLVVDYSVSVSSKFLLLGIG